MISPIVIPFSEGGDSPVLIAKTISSNGNYNAIDDNASGYSSVDVNVSVSGGVFPKDINFYDYNGTLVESWTLAELASATALPSNPSHSGLTAQGWNWTLADLKTTNRAMNVGQMYITDDGKTRLYITIAAEGRMTVPLYFSQTVSNGVTINWGDGSAIQTLSGIGNVNTTHTYSNIGDYIITLDVSDGCVLSIGSGSSDYCVMGGIVNDGSIYCNMLKKAEIGNNIIDIGNYAFSLCRFLSSITIPDNITNIRECAFLSCYFLSSITIPNSVTNIEDSAFSSCNSILSITIPDSVTNIGRSAFENSYFVSSITIPNSVTSIGAYAFNGFYSLSSIIIPKGVTNIGESMLSGCWSLLSITISDSVTNIGGYAFSGCQSLLSVIIPNGVTNIGNEAFNTCTSLLSITISDSVTSIGRSAFGHCYSLTSITIPIGITNIGETAFWGCYGVKVYHVLPTTPPTLSSTNVFSGIPSDCIIYVPVGTLAAYQSETNWSTYAAQMREEGT